MREVWNDGIDITGLCINQVISWSVWRASSSVLGKWDTTSFLMGVKRLLRNQSR